MHPLTDLLTVVDPTGCFPDAGGDVKCGLGGNTWNVNDWANYISFMKEIRAEIKARGLVPCLDDPTNSKCKYITTAAGMNPKLNDAKAPLKEWVEAQDFVNFMTYDYMGAWSNVAASQTALNTVTSLPPSQPQDFNIKDTVQVFLDAGVPASKMTIGLAAYGRGWGDTTEYMKESECKTGEYGATCPLSPGTWEAGVFSWWDVKANYLNKGDWTRKWDAEAQTPYLQSASKKGIIVYDDEESIKVGYTHIHRTYVYSTYVKEACLSAPFVLTSVPLISNREGYSHPFSQSNILIH
jgi:chitinase